MFSGTRNLPTNSSTNSGKAWIAWSTTKCTILTEEFACIVRVCTQGEDEFGDFLFHLRGSKWIVCPVALRALANAALSW